MTPAPLWHAVLTLTWWNARFIAAYMRLFHTNVPTTWTTCHQLNKCYSRHFYELHLAPPSLIPPNLEQIERKICCNLCKDYFHLDNSPANPLPLVNPTSNSPIPSLVTYSPSPNCLEILLVCSPQQSPQTCPQYHCLTPLIKHITIHHVPSPLWMSYTSTMLRKSADKKVAQPNDHIPTSWPNPIILANQHAPAALPMAHHVATPPLTVQKTTKYAKQTFKLVL